MKISKLYIEEHLHLQNLDFDFTYPEDFHIEEKRGKPLDKICLIGQSATGKTSLLELIFEYSKFIAELQIIDGQFLTNNKIKLNIEIDFLLNKNYFKLKNDKIFFEDKIYVNSESSGTSNFFLISENHIKDFFYFKANFISDSNLEIFTNNPINLIEKHSGQLKDINKYYKSQNYGTVFDKKVEIELWLFLLNNMLEYRKNFTQKMSELIHKGLLADAKKLSLEFQNWQKENPNELEEFAKKFNPVLEKLNLEVDLVNTEYSIPIKNKKTDEIIPIQNTSTGTKGLLLSFLPLFKLDTKDSIILIDEPERSLYPDMQMDLMDYYQNLAPEAQFIVATHSPFIAAAFEPEERFILYFNESGKVAVRRGESPIGDDPNDILNNDFGVNYYNKHAKEAYQKYISLKQKMASENDPKRKKELLLETVKLGDTYNF